MMFATKLLLALAVLVMGVALINHALELSFNLEHFRKPLNPLEYICCLWFGLFFCGLSFAYLYTAIPFNPKPLNLYDLAAVLFSLLMMPLFEALAVEPTWWMFLIFFPSLIFSTGHWIYKKYGWQRRYFIIITLFFAALLLFAIIVPVIYDYWWAHWTPEPL